MTTLDKNRVPQGSVPAGNPSASHAAGEGKSSQTYIAAGDEICGEIRHSGKIVVAGRFKGVIECAILIVEKTGHIEGNIIASNAVRVDGYVKGNIQSKKIGVANTAEIHGDLLSPDIGMELGAKVHGKFDSIQPAAADKRVPHAKSLAAVEEPITVPPALRKGGVKSVTMSLSYSMGRQSSFDRSGLNLQPPREPEPAPRQRMPFLVTEQDLR